MYSAGQNIWHPLSLPSIARVYRLNLHPGVPLFKKFLKDGLPSAHSKVNEGTGQGNITILIAAPVSVQNHCADRIIHHCL